MKVKWLMLVCLLVAVLVASGCAPAKAPTAEAPAGYASIRMVGGGIGSIATTAVMATAAVFNKYYPEIEWSSCSGISITGPVYLTKGTIKIHMVLAGGYIEAYGYDKIPESRIRSLNLPVPLIHYLFVVPEDKPWKDIAEVPRGLTLCPGTPGSIGPGTTEAWLQLAGLSKKDFNWVPLGKMELADAWRADKLDVALIAVSGMSPALIDMQTGARKFKPVGLSPQQLARAKAEKTFERIGFEPPSMGNLSEISAEAFKSDVVCPQQAYFLSSRDDFPEGIAYKMAKVIDEHNAELAQIFPAMKYATPQWHIKWARPPLDIHSGVAKYYKEKGYLK